MRFVYWMTDAQDRLPWAWRLAAEPRFAKMTWKLSLRLSKILLWLVLGKSKSRHTSSSKSLSTRLLTCLTVSRWFTTYQREVLPRPLQLKSCPVLKRLSPISIGFDWLKQNIVTWGGHHGHRRIQRFFGFTASQQSSSVSIRTDSDFLRLHHQEIWFYNAKTRTTLSCLIYATFKLPNPRNRLHQRSDANAPGLLQVTATPFIRDIVTGTFLNYDQNHLTNMTVNQT